MPLAEDETDRSGLIDIGHPQERTGDANLEHGSGQRPCCLWWQQ
jgi:hypothetical protein